MDGTDRVVLVAAGFGVWQAGRHLASARWADVVRVRAFGRDAGTTDPSILGMQLRDGTEILVQETLPGFGPFLSAAETTLPGMSQSTAWLASVGKTNETVLFDRYPAKI